MQNKYFPPTFQQTAFHCPHCQVYAKQDWEQLMVRHGMNLVNVPVFSGQCEHCEERHYWSYDQKGDAYMAIPEASNLPPPHPMMPSDVCADYMEAAAVFVRSPRSSAALLRLALQKLLKHLGLPGKSIDGDIGTLVSQGLPQLVQQALDVCRVVGNEAVHPGKLDLKDTPQLTAQLFAMLNFIVSDRIERPAVIADLYAELPA